MKKNKNNCAANGLLIGTDGSTLNIELPYAKTNLFVNPDLKSNPLWLPETEGEHLRELNKKSTKFKNYEFSFSTLVDSSN